MKFAHDFKQNLASQDFPPHWVERAIPYSQLKKCLKKVQRELQDLGLDQETLRALLTAEETAPVALQYKLRESGSKFVRPKLTVNVHLRDGVAVDASLTPTSRGFLEKLASEILDEHERESLAQIRASRQTDRETTTDANNGVSNGDSNGDNGNYETIQVPLVFDAEFFDMLQSDVNELDALQAEEQKQLTAEITELSKEVSAASRPSRFSKSDLARWREIFELYLDSNVFFATQECDHGARSSQRALNQLQWFQNEVENRNLARKFKVPQSRQAFSRFLQLNASLLKNLQFEELNKLAVSKILKKFDKRTAFGVSKSFPKVIFSKGLLAGSIAKDVCASMSQELVSVVPQINDYLCPVCFSVAYRPRRKETHCPLCRADVVMSASADNLDHRLEKYLEKYFPKEVKEKQRSNDIERGIEDYGPGYKHQDCLVM
ncbi:spx [Cordyceps fumosorosea ARSEF 2679]|uniref:Spx n=1 Tax=Cordyceps fumosorosea (strain ARSEF 2679) TaxID=1081104 RepID=A0A168EG74_CORFA|nr:spx [Cordyceps fumosorosea ARSEF 2679]OAA73768.1 spx [Cordyceps fumosorosea ARSEF 2679]